MSHSHRPVVAVLESRMKSELGRLIEKHGGHPLSVPLLREAVEFDPEALTQLLDELDAGRYEVVIFLTGIAVSLLLEFAEKAGRRAEVLGALRRATTVTRGPKPTAALRGFGIPPTLTARDPFTAAEVLDTLTGIGLAGRRVLLFHYGERSETLAETLLACGVALHERWLYRWAMPDDLRPVDELIGRIVEGSVDAIAVTCQVQFRHLVNRAEELGHRSRVIRALNEHVTVGCVGPKCSAVLQAYGVEVHVTPEHPKMGPLAVALMRRLARRSAKVHRPLTTAVS